MRRAILALVAAAALTATATAHADIKEVNLPFWMSNNSNPSQVQCGKGQSLLSHGNSGHGFVRSTTSSTRYSYNVDCLYPQTRPAGNIRTRWTWQRKRDGVWGFCKNGPIWANANSATWSVSDYKDWGYLPCGKGDYRSSSYHVIIDNGVWHQGGWPTVAHFFN